MTITLETTVGAVATEHPLATRVFARHKIDYCCGGGAPIGKVCAKKGIDAETLLGEIESEIRDSNEPGRRWDQEPVPELIDHILTQYHRPLDEELPRLEQMARKVHQVHGDKQPEMLMDLLVTYVSLKEELEQHMEKEEKVLFPMILQGENDSAPDPIAQLESEHESAGVLLAKLRNVTHDYEVPEGACTTWRALWAGLEALEGELHRHIHLENNILHRRVLERS